MKKSKRRIAYECHIASPEWKRKRLERIAIDKRCRGCGATENLEVHHVYPDGYKNIPNESVEHDLTTFCKDCHEAIHSSIDKRKYSNKSVPTNNMPNVAKRSLTDYGMAKGKIPISRNLSNDTTQRRFGKFNEPDSEANETHIGQAKEDRGRFRGIG